MPSSNLIDHFNNPPNPPTMKPEKELEAWIEMLSEKVKRNIEVVTPETLGQNFLLHITKDTNLKKFIPHIGKRQGNQEDRTVPRVTVAPTLLGCFIGYASSWYDFSNLASTGKKEELGYKGGWGIYAVEFEAAIRPTPKLVYDAKMSGEHWLVTYSPATVEYKPKLIGKVFYRSVRLVAREGKQPDAHVEMYVEIQKEEGIQFSKNIKLTKGYWAITGPMDYRVASWMADKDFKATELTKADYLTAKMESASMLNYEERPAYLAW